MSKKPSHLTTAFGAPIGEDNTSLTLGPGGPVLMQDVVLLEKLAHFGRERIPERVVHAKGAGAFGWFEVTADVTKYTCADFLSKPGLRTEMFARFSTVAGERGAADADRDPRGFALKFYTRDGNYDLVGNNTPVFFIRDPMKFPDFIHSQKRLTNNNLRCPNAQWDFWSLTPECLHQVVILFSDRGIPANFRHMNGYGSHTYMWYNEKKEYFWVKYHFKTDQGNKALFREDAQVMAGKDPDHATRDLYEAIARKEYPAWTLEVQIMTPEQAAKFPYDPFDVTKVWPHKLVPPMTIGRMVLDRAPDNYFQDVEQSAFNPSSFVPGIGPSPDKMLQGRLFSYHDTHLHRLGSNYHLIPVNQAKNARVDNYQRDGFHFRIEHGGAGPNYWPNSMGGPAPTGRHEPEVVYEGATGRFVQPVTAVDYEQPAALYNKVMNDEQRERFLGNVAAGMNGAMDRIRLRSVVMFWKMDAAFGEKLAKAVNVDPQRAEALSKVSFAELVEATAE